jgi:hypothetical protein
MNIGWTLTAMARDAVVARRSPNDLPLQTLDWEGGAER